MLCVHLCSLIFQPHCSRDSARFKMILFKQSQMPWLVYFWHFPKELSHPFAFDTHLYNSANYQNRLMTHVFTLQVMQVYTGWNQSTHHLKRNKLDISEIFMAEGTMGAYCRLVQQMTALGGLPPFSFHPGSIQHRCCSVPFRDVSLSLSNFNRLLYPRPPVPRLLSIYLIHFHTPLHGILNIFY